MLSLFAPDGLCYKDPVHDKLSELGGEQAEVSGKARYAHHEVGEQVGAQALPLKYVSPY